MSAAEEEEAPQGLVAGKYRLTQLLGRGGMGSVWEGTHTSLGTRVAVKFIESEYAESKEAVDRFENEARAAATLRSKHVVQVYDHGVADDGRPYIVMEFLSGEPLDRRLERFGGRIAPDETARMLLQVARALSKAHEAGIVHRDLKPENVFLVWDDEDQADIAKVVDFGIAKFTDRSLGVSSSTRTGSVLGTPYYMSPEQARGLRSVDYRSDLWSLGVIAYRCIIGKLPFEGEAVGDLLVKICTAPLPVPSQQLPGVPPGFDVWFARALAREPEQRFASAIELAESLCEACGVSVRSAMPSSMVASHVAVPAVSSGHHQHPSGPHSPTLPAEQHTPPPGAVTGAPTTQTPVASRGSSKAPLIAAAVGGLVLLGVAAVVAIKLLAGSAPAEAVEATESAQPEPAMAAAPEPTPAPEVVPAGPEAAPLQREVEPEPEKEEPKPAVRPAPRPRPRPVARPAPKPAPSPTPAPKPAPGPIDVGY